MRNQTKRVILALLLLVAVIVSLCPTTFAAGQPSKYSTTSNSGDRDTVCTTLDGTTASNYYTGSYTYDNLSKLSSSSLLTTLRTFMTNTHKYQTSYGECKSYATKTDCENENGRITLIYTSYSATANDAGGGGSGWDREHVWPKSQGGFDKDGAGSDLHHIRPSDSKINNTRGNTPYGNVNGGSAVNGNLSKTVGGYSGGGYFEPHDNVKGDVARICLYVYVRWGGTYSMSNNLSNVFQSVDVLLEWCALDPVDTWEMGRNEVVQKIQGNRNVFIDYPELAWQLFGKTAPSDMVTPSGEASGNGGNGGSSSGNEGGNTGDGGNSGTTTCTHASTYVSGAYAATCGNSGFTGNTICSTCGVKVKSGSSILPTGNHTYGTPDADGWKTCTGCGTRVKGEDVVPPAGDVVNPSTCPHTETEVRDAVPGCTENGYSGDTYCVACDTLIMEGTITFPEGHDWQPISDTLEQCTKCKEGRKIDNTGVVVAIAGGSIGGVSGIAVAVFFLLKRRPI